ncbi:alpha/beta fold hydrolase [Desulfocastanea catecholica]
MNLIDIPFNCGSHDFDGMNLSYLDSGGEKPVLHFYHANGFPVSVYLPMLIRLTDSFRVIALGLRGQDAQTAGNTSWHDIAGDLIRFLDEKNTGPVFGVGHSVGSVATILAAVRRPDLFKKILLIDPVLLPYKAVFGHAMRGLLGRKGQLSSAQRARARRSHWTDRQEMYGYLQSKSLFRRFHESFLRSYVTYGAKPAKQGGVELLCPPEAEARIFENYPLDIWFQIRRLQTLSLIIRGEYSDVLLSRTVERFCASATNARSYVMKGAGHLIPMEQPDTLITVIEGFCNCTI